MATLRNDTVVRSADGQGTSAIVTATNIGTYGVAANSTYYVGTTQNVFNRASGAQSLTGVSIDGNAATVTNGVYTTGAQTIGGTKTFSDGVVVNGATYYTFNKPTTNAYQTVALFGSAGAGLFLTTDSAIIGVGAYYNNGWIATATSGRQIDFAGGNFTFGAFSGATVGGAAGWGTVATLSSAGSFVATGDVRTIIFYDSNNTAYYCDPASTSNLVGLTVANTITGSISGNAATATNVAWSGITSKPTTLSGFGITDALPLSGGTLTGNLTITKASAYLYLNGTNSDSELRFMANGSDRWAVGMNVGDATENLNIYNYTTTTVNFTILKASGNVGIGITNPTQKLHVVGVGYSDTDFRAPIFYDSNDTAYYVDPNSVSRLSSLRVYSAFDTASSDVYANMRVMRNNATTDGMYIGYGNLGSTSALTRIFGGGATTGELSKYSTYTLEPGSFRSPIFYDSDNTAYYVDAASTSNLVGLTVANTITGSVSGSSASCSGNAATATILQTARNINGTSFNGSAAITTASWGTARTLTIGSTGKSVDGSAAVAWSLAEIGAAATNQTMFIGTTSVAINRTSASQTLTGISIDGSAASCTGNAATVTNGVYTTGAQTIAGVKTFSDNLIANAKLEVSGTSGDSLPTFKIISTTAPNTFNYAGTILNSSLGASRNYVLFIGKASSTKNAAYIGYNHSGTDGSDTNFLTLGHYASDNLLNILGNGNVGIGTTSPSQKLHVVGTGFASSDFRAPIFYDSNDTAYYVDPNSNSILLDVEARGGINLRRDLSAATGISFYNTSYYNWQVYMAAAAATGCGANGNLTAPNGLTNVSSWALRSRMEAVGSYGWLWEVGSGGAGGGGATATSVMELDTGGILTLSGQVRVPIFYDRDNTAYYLDPAGTSNLNALVLAGSSYFRPQTWIQMDGSYGMYWPNTNGCHIEGNTLSSYGSLAIRGTRNGWKGIHFYEGGNTPHLMFDGSANGGVYFETGGRWASYYSYGNNCWGFGTSTTNSAYNLYAPTGVYSGGRVDGTIFYDSNNTGYYLDPASTSNLNNLTVAGTMTFGSLAYTTESRRSKNSSNVDIETVTGLVSPSGPTFLEIRGFCPPTMYRTTADRPAPYGLGFGNGSESGGIMPIGAGDNLQEIMLYGSNTGPTTFTFKRQNWEGSTYDASNSNIYSASVFSINTGTGAVTASTDIRSPIYYDQNNTAYYIDAASTSNLVGLTVANTITGSITGNAGGSSASCTGNAATATILQTARNINGTSFNGSAAITTATWGTARTITIGSTGKSVDGSAAVAWSLAEIGAAATNQTMFIGTTSLAINRSSASQTLTGVSIDGNSATTTLATKATRANGNFYIDDNFGNTVVGNYNAARLQGVFAMGDSYKLAADGTAVGTLYGLAWSHPNFGGVAANLADHGLLILQNGVFKGAWGGGSLRTPGDVRGTLFYDWDNTGYYCDPASTSNLNTITAAGNVTAAQYYTGGWFRNNGSGNGLYNEATTQHFYSDSTNYWNVASSASAQGIRLRTGGHAGTVRGYFYADTANDVGLLNNAGNWRVRVVGGDYTLIDGSSVRAQLFYDSNDTTYYTDPAGFSLISSMGIGGLTSSSNVQMFDSQVNASSSYQQAPPLIIRKDSSATGTIDQAPVGLFIFNLNGTDNTWTKLSMGSREVTGAGNTVSIAGLAAQKTAGTNGAWATGNLHFWTKSGATPITNMVAYSSGYVQSDYSFRAPIFYDSNDTAYYLDPRSTSVLSGLKLNGVDNEAAGTGSDAILWINKPNNNDWGIRVSGNLEYLLKLEGATSHTYNIQGLANGSEFWRCGTDLLYHNSNIRAPIFYDSNNTAYYIDAASTSNLVGLTVANTITGSITGNAGGSSASCTGNANSATSSGCLNSDTGNVGGSRLQYWQVSGNTTLNPDGEWYNAIRMGHGDPVTYYGNTLAVKMTGSNLGDIYTRTLTNGTQGSWNRFWNNNNDGSGSGLDADLLDGYNSATANTANTIVLRDGSGNFSAGTITGALTGNVTGNVTGTAGSISGFNNPTTAATANTIVYRDGSGHITGNYIFGSYLNSTDDINTGTITHIMAKFGDNYHRSATAAKVATFISGQTMNIAGSSTSCSGNAATVTNGVYTGTTNTYTGTNYFQSNLGTTSGSLSSPPLQAYATGTNSAFMSFHRAGSFAINFGLDSDNILRIGGWSAAANRWQLDTSGNQYLAASCRATIFYDIDNTGYYLDPNSTTSLRTVGSWRSDSSSWDGEFSGKIQYHSNHWYIQAADLLIYRNSGGSNVFTVNQSGVAIASADMRAPIFYDNNDTGYYTDPASTSILNVVRANSYVQKSASQSLSGTVGCTIDVNAAGIHVLTLAASTTISSFTYNNRTANPSVNTIMLVIKYGGTASITWTNVLWANGVTPTITGASGYADVYMLTSYQGTTGVWIGTVVAQGLVSTSL